MTVRSIVKRFVNIPGRANPVEISMDTSENIPPKAVSGDSNEPGQEFDEEGNMVTLTDLWLV